MRQQDLKLLSAKTLSIAGDSAFDFALPIALIAFSPGSTLLAGLFIFVRKVLYILLMPRLSRLLDRHSGLSSMSFILLSQMMVITLITILFSQLVGHTLTSLTDGPWHIIALFALAALLDSIRQISEGLSEIAIKNSWVPKLYPESERTGINARLKSLSLTMQIVFPLITSVAFFSHSTPGAFPHGFYYVAAFNIVTFIPEYALLRSLAKSQPKLLESPSNQQSTVTPYRKGLGARWRALRQELVSYSQEPVFLCELARCFLGITVLSSQSIFLRTFLLDGAKLTEFHLSVFLGAAAVMGLLGVRVFVWLRSRGGLERAGYYCLLIQMSFILLSTGAFALGQQFIAVFVGGIAAARIGLHGYAVAIAEIEQNYISPARAGFVMGYAVAIQQVGNLVIMGIATYFSLYSEFYIPVGVSCVCSVLAFVLYRIWLDNIAKNQKVRQ